MTVVKEKCTKGLKLLDYVGKTINSWTVLGPPEYEEFFIQRKTKRERYWYCRCKCGDIHPKEPSAIINNRSLMCKKCSGINKRTHFLKDYENKKVGKWIILPNEEEKIINYSNGGYKRQWKCQCDCGNQSYIDVNSLIKNTVNSCNACFLKSRKKDHTKYIGMKIFNMTVLNNPEEVYYDSSGHKRYKWTVQCSCGKTEQVSENDLFSGKKKKCRDCYITNKTEHIYVDNVGKKFFDFTVLDTGEKRSNKGDKRLWPVQCKCGTYLEIDPSVLIRGNRRTCSNCYHYEKDEKVPKLNKYFNQIKKGASERAIDFKIQPEYILELMNNQNNSCYYSNVPIKIGVSASIDRIDSDKGYIEGNLVMCHKSINFMKQDKSFSSFIKICNIISKQNHQVYGDVFIYVSKGVGKNYIEQCFKIIKQLNPLSQFLFMNENTDVLEELCIVTNTNYRRKSSFESIKAGKTARENSFDRNVDTLIFNSAVAYLIVNENFIDSRLNTVSELVNNYIGKWSNTFSIKGTAVLAGKL